MGWLYRTNSEFPALYDDRGGQDEKENDEGGRARGEELKTMEGRNFVVLFTREDSQPEAFGC